MPVDQMTRIKTADRRRHIRHKSKFHGVCWIVASTHIETPAPNSRDDLCRS